MNPTHPSPSSVSQSPLPGIGQAHVRGSSTYSAPAGSIYRVFATAFDLGFSCCLFSAYFLLSSEVPSLNLWTIPAALALTSALWLGQKFLFGVTLGERLWEIRATSRFQFNPPLVQCHPLSPFTQSIGSFLTLFSFIAALGIAFSAIVLNPVGMKVESEQWQAYFPPETEAPALALPDSATAPAPVSAPSNASHWTVMPFYYSLGAWPKAFQQRPVLYSLPYQKGPPARFAGQISASWAPTVRMIFEGPKTPLSPQKELYSRGEIRDCLLGFWGSLSQVPGCLTLRSEVLERHIHDLRRLAPTQWEIRWINVANSALKPSEQLQGIYISARNRERGQDRFVMITARGTHQTFILNYPNNETGRLARETFHRALRSMRVSDDLGPGEAWVDQSLERVNLANVSRMKDPQQAAFRLAEIQALLIARISVNPKAYDTYFHLAGTALMLGRAAIQLRKLPPPLGNPDLAADILDVAKPMVQAAQHYATDVNPREKRNALLQNFLAESQKF